MKRIICILLLIVVTCTGGFIIRGEEPAWNEIWDPNMVDLVGCDGTKYYTSKDYWVLIYNQDGTTTYRNVTGGVRQKRLRIACYDGTIQSVYCIGAGLSYQYGGDKYYKEDIDVPNDYFERLPLEVRQGIYLAMLFGYEDGVASPVPDTNEDDYWLATQVIIWEYQQGLRKGPEERQDNGPIQQNVYYNMIHNYPAEKCYDWILSNIRTYLTFPSFLTLESILYKEQNVAVQHEKDGLYTLDLYDDNHTETLLTVTDAQGQKLDWVEIVHLGGSNYRLEATKPVDGTVKLWVEKDIPRGHKKLLFFSDGSGNTQVVTCRSVQSTAARDVRPFNLSTQDYEEFGDLRITKRAEKGTLNFAFQVQGLDGKNEHICETVYTDSEGVGTLAHIPAGRYQIQELLPVDSPWKQPAAQVVTVLHQQTAEAVFENILKRGSLTIYKRFEGRDTPWMGIEFEVTGSYQGEIVYQSVVSTDETGNCVLADLPIGQYVIRELQGAYTQWYETSAPVSVEIKEDDPAEVYIHNAAKKTQLEIHKTGAVIGSALDTEGVYLPVLQQEALFTAVFDLYAEEDICGDDGTIRFAKGTLVDTISRRDGQYRSCLLYPGVYRLQERVCPDGYIPCEDQIITLELNREHVIEIENELKPQTVRFTKSLEYGTAKQLAEVRFGLYAAESFVMPDGTVVPQNGLLDTAYAQEDGTVQLCTLFSGAVYVKELAVPTGYQMDPNCYSVENGTICDGNPLVNYLLPVNPKTGEDKILYGFAGGVILVVCACGIIAFYRKSRYNN